MVKKDLPHITDVYNMFKHLTMDEAIETKLEKYDAPKCPFHNTLGHTEEDVFLKYFKILEDIPLIKEELIYLLEKYTGKELLKSNGKPYVTPTLRMSYLLTQYGVRCYGDKHKDLKRKNPKVVKEKVKRVLNPKHQRYDRNKTFRQAKDAMDNSSRKLSQEEKTLEELRLRLAVQEKRVKGFTTKKEKVKDRYTKERLKSIDDTKPSSKPVVVEEKYKKTIQDKKIIFEPNVGPQTAFLSASEKDVLYGGQAGGGKSYALIIDPLRYCSNKNHRGLILRRTMKELRELIDKSRELYPQAFKGSRFKEVEKTWFFPSGAQIMFGYLEKDADVYQFQGQAYSWIGYDELTHLATEFPWQYLASRLRTTDPDLPTFMRATTNPGGVGHHWVKKRYIDPAPANETFIGNDGIQRKFIPATLHDNPHIAKDGQYEAMLKSLPEVHRRRLLDGDWDINEGAAFSEFQPNKHVIPPFEIPPHWERVKGVDYGYAAESCCLWGALDPSDGTLIIYKELYEKGLTGDDLALKMTSFEKDERRSILGVLDTAAWNRVGYSGPTIGETLVKAGHKLRPADKNRIAGKVQVHERLKEDPTTGRPKMQIVSTCVNLIREFSSLMYDKTKPEDVDTKMSDHAYDALRYLIMSRPRIRDTFTDMFAIKQNIGYAPSDTGFGY
jgi:hypothetical protein